VVILIIAILAALLLPTLALAKEHAKKTSCLNNLRQLQLAYTMYAQDYGDLLPPNIKLDETDTDSWVMGQMNNASDATNVALLEECLLWPYSRSTGIYKCPSDTGPNPRCGALTCRSYSVNTYMNGYDVGCDHEDDWPSNQIFIVQTKLSAITSPGPGQRMVFCDESVDTIDDGNFSVVPTGGGYTVVDWWNCAAARHNNGTGFSFADGHAADLSWTGKQLLNWELAQKTGNEDIAGGGPAMTGNDLRDLNTVQFGQAQAVSQ
jgi:prepilin-type processing-associated H-X9-DG protein